MSAEMNEDIVIIDADHPPRTTCQDCGGDGSSPELMCTCPGWVAVEDLAHADLKALLAGTDLSLGVPK